MEQKRKKKKNRKSAVPKKLDPVHLAQEIMLAYFTSFLTSKAAGLSRPRLYVSSSQVVHILQYLTIGWQTKEISV